MKNILIFGYFGVGNLGDEANLRQLIKLLRETDAKNQITVISADPSRTASAYDVAAVGKFDLFGIIKALFKADLLLGNGGSHFQDITSKRSLLYYSALVLAAKLLKVRVFLYGQGIGPLRSGLGKFITGRVLTMADLITVRDRLSIVALAELNVRKPEIHFTAEPLLASNGVEALLVKKYWGEQEQGKQLKLGLIIKDFKFIKKGFWDRLLDCLSWDSNVETYLIPVQNTKDSEFLQEFSANYGLTILNTDEGWEQLQQIAGGLDLLVSARLHGLVAGVLQGVPCYGLAADPKVEGFCLQLGIPFSILTFETEWMGISNKITNFLVHPQECLGYQSKLPFWKARALENQIILKQYLENND
ncbi:MAG: polysaccharide pyruvyl transferase family protein [Bacteroidota bacterium]